MIFTTHRDDEDRERSTLLGQTFNQSASIEASQDAGVRAESRPAVTISPATAHSPMTTMAPKQTPSSHATNSAQPSPGSAQPSASNPSDLRFRFSDFLLKRRDIDKMIDNIPTPILATGTGLPDPNVVHVFDSQEAFDEWASTTKFRSQFIELNQIIKVARDNSSFVGVQPPAGEPIAGPVVVSNADLRAEAHTPVDWRSTARRDMQTGTDAFKNLQPNPTRLSSLTVLYEENAFGGVWHPLGPAAIPNLASVKMDRRVTSLRVSGICLLTDQTWFQGARLYLVGDPVLQVKDLSEWGFSKRAMSAIII